ncbi:MAG: transposase [Chloroflexi bacterium]|nr:MAG: transposase [Chloroflexota bacterium]
MLKSGIRGVYHSVSAKWLQSYLDEYACGTTIGNIPNAGRGNAECLSAKRSSGYC